MIPLPPLRILINEIDGQLSWSTRVFSMASVSFHAISLSYCRRPAPAARPAQLSKPAGLQRSLGTAAVSLGGRNLGPRSRNLRGIRVESADKGALEPMVPPYNVLITGSTKGPISSPSKNFPHFSFANIICSRNFPAVFTQLFILVLLFAF